MLAALAGGAVWSLVPSAVFRRLVVDVFATILLSLETETRKHLHLDPNTNTFDKAA
jgi:hypothetical protein